MSAIKLTKRVYENRGDSDGNRFRPIVANPIVHMTAERGPDYAICIVETPAYGLNAGDKFALKLSPVPEPKSPPRPDQKKKKPRPEIKDFVAGNISGGKAFGKEVIVIPENSWLDKKETVDGLPVIKARWIKTVIHDPENPKNFAYQSGYVSVGPLDEQKNNEIPYRQRRGVFIDAVHDEATGTASPEGFVFNGTDAFKEQAVAWLNHLGRDAEIIVRLSDNAAILSGEVAEGEQDIMSKSLYLVWDKTRGEKGEYLSAEESVERFLDNGPEVYADGNPNPDYQTWRNNIEASGTPDAEGYTFDAIVFRRGNTGKASMENMLESDYKFEMAKQEVERYNMPVSSSYPERVFLKGTLLYATKANDDGTERVIPTETFALDNFGPTYTAGELPGGRPDDVQAVLDQRAKDRGEKRYFDFKDKKNGAKQNQEEDLNMGDDPAPSTGGLGPS